MNRKERSERRRLQREGGLSELLALGGGGYWRGMTEEWCVLGFLCGIRTLWKKLLFGKAIGIHKENEGSHTFL